MDDARWLDNGNYLFYKTRRAEGETFYIVNTGTLLKKEITETAELDSLKNLAYPKRDRRTPGYWAAEDDEKNGGASKSPNGEMEAFIQENNLFVRYINENRVEQISRDGSQGEYYSSYIYWSPDSKNVALMKIRPAEKQYFHMIESAPADQLQGKLHKREYRKPGSALPFKHPHNFNIETKNMSKPSTALFENPFSNG